MIEFANVVLNQYWEIVGAANHLSGVTRALKAARINCMNGLTAQMAGDLLRLTNANLAQSAIAGTLAPSLKVPIRSSVAKQNDLHRRYAVD